MAKKIPGTAIANKPQSYRENFCHEYVLNGNNATQAYMNAGYKCKISSAWVSAHNLLRTTKVIERIKELQVYYHSVLTSNREKIIQEIDGLSMFDPINMFDANGKLLPLHKMDAVTRKSVNEIEIMLGDDNQLVAKVKYGKDKKGYLDMMAKFYNLYEEHQKAAGNAELIVHYMYPQDEKL